MLKGLLTAREGSYFKTEQEDELQVYRRRRIKEGAIKPEPRIEGEGRGFIELREAGGNSRAGSEGVRPARSFETADVVAAAVHVDERWVPDSEGNGRHLQSALAAARAVERTELEGHGTRDTPLPEEVLASSRHKAMMDKTLLVGTRAFMYGSLIAAGGIAGVTALTASYCDIHSTSDLRKFMIRHLRPSVDSMKASLVPWKTYFKQLDMSKYVSKDSIK